MFLRLFQYLRDHWWKPMEGDAKWSFTSKVWRWLSDRTLWWPMVLTIGTTVWGWIVSLPGPILFVNCLGVFSITLLIANEIQLRRIRTKWEHHQLAVSISTMQHAELEEACRTIAELQARLSTLESQQPHLKAEPYFLQRMLDYDQFSGFHSLRDHMGIFTFLRVTNEPKNLNSRAIASRLYAKISFCNEQWNDLFLPISGAWFSLRHPNGPDVIGSPKHNPENLAPHQFAHLGIALRYQWDDQHRCYALSESSGEWPNWFNPDLALPSFKATIYIKVTIGCDGFQATYYYTLTDDEVELMPIDAPG